MNSTACISDVVITTEHRRFAEFCDACRHYGYIGLCYGTPGVGKTLSARHYANWDQVEAYSPYKCASDDELAAVIGSNTIFYTPKVANSPSRAFRKSVTSSGACSVAVGPSNRARFAGARDRNNFMRIYETLY
jgi:hypothetical protein